MFKICVYGERAAHVRMCENVEIEVNERYHGNIRENRVRRGDSTIPRASKAGLVRSIKRGREARRPEVGSA